VVCRSIQFGVPCAYSVFADKIVVLVAYTDDFIADLVTCARNFAATFTTARGSAMLPILMAASMEHEDTADRLRAGFSTPLQETVQARLLAGYINEATAQAAADAIVGGITYSILRDGRSYTPRQAELTTRIDNSLIPARVVNPEPPQ
jgi:hypothetical protein